VQQKNPINTFRELCFARDVTLDHDYMQLGAHFWWLDYFSPRQCQNDFQTKQVVALIRQIGFTVAELDDDWIEAGNMMYFQRSFCILELYATVSGGGRLLCYTGQQPDEIEDFLEGHPIDAQQASTRRPKDKELIDDYITSDIGFAKFNAAVAEHALRGAMECVGAF
jgi:hypothetical protein